MLDEKTKSRVLALIDRNTWKHSCHLVKNQYGYTDWWSKKNLQDCLEIALRANKEAINLLELSGMCAVDLQGAINQIEVQEKIDAGPE